MDTYDYKPALEKYNGQKLGPKEKPEGFTAPAGAIMKSPFEFKQYGKSGRWVSSVFPEQAKLVDEMAFFMAMASKTNVHGPGTYMMNSGFVLPGFPCMGAWISPVGSWAAWLIICQPLWFCRIRRGLPYNQRGCFSSGFLPAKFQGTVIQANSTQAVPDLFAPKTFQFATHTADVDGLKLLDGLNRTHAACSILAIPRLDARIESYELAAKMQLSAPEAFDISREPESVRSALVWYWHGSDGRLRQTVPACGAACRAWGSVCAGLERAARRRQ